MSTYAELLAAARQYPESADFHALRMAYTRTDEYDPYQEHAALVEELGAALQAGELDQALAAIDGLLGANYLDIEAHMAADYVFTRQGDDANSAYHRAFATGLIRALLSTGTGADFGSALIVLSTSEEYLVLRILGLASQGQRLVEHEGHWFDILTVTRADQPHSLDLYFNIDLPFSRQAGMI